MAQALAPHRVKASLAEYEEFTAFCAEYDIDPTGASIALYLTAQVTAHGESGPGMRRRLARLDLAAYIDGREPPSQDRNIRRVLRGLHRQAPLGRHPERAEPLYAGHVRVLVDHTMSPTRRQIRDHAFLVTVNHTGLRATEASRLRWRDIHITKTAVEVTATLLHGHRRPQIALIRLAATGDSLTCPVLVLTQLRQLTPPGDGPVFAYRGEQAANKRLRALIHEIGALDAFRHPLGTPWVSNETLAAASEEALRPRAVAVRDRALLLIGYLAALLPGEAAELSVGDIRTERRGLVISLPHRRYPEIALPRSHAARYCPAEAWGDWLHVLAKTRNNSPEHPAFPHCDYYQPTITPTRLTPGGLSKIVLTRTQAAGLLGRYPFTSLRAGFVRTALREGVAKHDIVRQVGYHYLAAVEAQDRREHLLRGNLAEVIGL